MGTAPKRQSITVTLLTMPTLWESMNGRHRLKRSLFTHHLAYLEIWLQGLTQQTQLRHKQPTAISAAKHYSKLMSARQNTAGLLKAPCTLTSSKLFTCLLACMLALLNTYICRHSTSGYEVRAIGKRASGRSLFDDSIVRWVKFHEPCTFDWASKNAVSNQHGSSKQDQQQQGMLDAGVILDEILQGSARSILLSHIFLE